MHPEGLWNTWIFTLDERKIHFSLLAASVHPTSIFSWSVDSMWIDDQRVSTYKRRRRRVWRKRILHFNDNLTRMKVYTRFLPICPCNPVNPTLVTRNDAFKLEDLAKRFSTNARTPSSGGGFAIDYYYSAKKKKFELLRLYSRMFMFFVVLDIGNFGCAAAWWLRIKARLGRPERSMRTRMGNNVNL